MSSPGKEAGPGAGGGRAGASREPEQRPSKAWGILVFGVIGATVTTLAVTQLRRSFDWVHTQLNRMQSTTSWRTTSSNSSRGSFSEEARRRYHRRMQEEYEEEQERLQRIRRMQSVFNRERNKFKRSYESWRENGSTGGYSYIPRDDWYWKTDTSHTDHKGRETHAPGGHRVYPMSQHYAILGLDRSRATPYTDAEVKNAFRTKAMECHPDQNQDNKEAAEEKFKEVVKSYEAIKSERANGTS